MKHKKGEIPNWLLSAKEEVKLTPEEKSDYCKKMREFCRTRKLTNTTKGATTIAPYLKKPTNAIAKVVTKALAGGEVEMITDGLENFRGDRRFLHVRIKECWIISPGYQVVPDIH